METGKGSEDSSTDLIFTFTYIYSCLALCVLCTGRRHLQVRLVEPSLKSLNSGDCFALVTEKDLFSWIGKESNPYEKAKVCKCMYFCRNCYMPFFLFLPSLLYVPLLIQLLLLMPLPPPWLFLLPSSANAVSFAANTATDVNSSSSFALSLLLIRLLLWFSDIACLVSSIASATTTTSVSASASSATPAQFLPPPLILCL